MDEIYPGSPPRIQHNGLVIYFIVYLKFLNFTLGSYHGLSKPLGWVTWSQELLASPCLGPQCLVYLLVFDLPPSQSRPFIWGNSFIFLLIKAKTSTENFHKWRNPTTNQLWYIGKKTLDLGPEWGMSACMCVMEGGNEGKNKYFLNRYYFTYPPSLPSCSLSMWPRLSVCALPLFNCTASRKLQLSLLIQGNTYFSVFVKN